MSKIMTKDKQKKKESNSNFVFTKIKKNPGKAEEN